MSEKYKFNDPEGIYFVTLTIVYWIDLFTRKEFKHLVLESLRHCQTEKSLVIHAWCLMPSHLHMIISSEKGNLSGIIRDFKKHTAKGIIKEMEVINESRRDWLLRGFKNAGKSLKRVTNYKVWQDGSQPKQLSENLFMDQKLDYIHNNPVKDEIVLKACHYNYSSARDYSGDRGLLEVVMIK